MKDSITQADKSNKFRRVIIIGIWILIWQLLSQKIGNDIFLPGPLQVAAAMMKGVKESTFWLSIYHSLWKIGVGFLIGFILAVLLGTISCKFSFIREFIAPAISMIKSIPVASFIILVLVWVNSRYLSVFISFFVTFPIIYISVLEGVDNVNRDLLEMTQVYQVKPLIQLRYLYLSEVLPYIISGVKVASGMCWKAGISGEIIGLPKYSIGEQLYLSKIYLNISDLFAWTFVIVFVCFAFEKVIFLLIRFAEKKLLS